VRARLNRLVVVLLGAAFCAPAPAAHAAGPPLPSSASGKAGVVAPGGTERILTRSAGEDTDLIAVRRADRTVLRSRVIPGHWQVSPAALDGATTGLSADARTLVLARPERGFPPAETRLAVVDATTLVGRRAITLPGFFTVDAISPDGRWLYLIQYSSGDFADYRVRALDTRSGKLAARDVVDPRNPNEQMGGLPVTRVMSRDGRWAYTLYTGGEESFIHALDTVGRTAACIDLDMMPADSDLSGMHLSLSADGRVIRVRSAGAVVALVNARTFAVREPGEEFPKRADPPAEQRPAPAAAAGETGFPWPPLVAVAVLAALCGAVATIVRRGAWRPTR
jgi:hypothetical protein